MAKKKKNIPQYGTVTRKGVLYYRTRILDADGKQVSLYGTTCEELYDKEQEARRQVAEIIFHREHPTVDAIRKSVAGYTEGLRLQYEELHYQAFGRYVYGGSNSG